MSRVINALYWMMVGSLLSLSIVHPPPFSVWWLLALVLTPVVIMTAIGFTYSYIHNRKQKEKQEHAKH